LSLKTTPLNAIHRRLGAKMIDFGGWDMPVQYASVLDEHRAVRQRVGLFDVSHMGEIEIRGPQALRLVNYVTTNDASRLAAGQAQYSGLLYEHGGFVDDILVHKVADDYYFLCVNASNQDKNFEHIRGLNQFDAIVENAGAGYAQLAVQGPRALDTLQKLTPVRLASIRYYHFVDDAICTVPARIARTGYT
jgi:aminomethyltransferase